MRKVTLLVSVILILIFVAYSQRGNIVQRILPTVIEQAMTNNATETLADGLHIALCGAGGPMPDPKRSGSCVAVVAGDKLFVVDAGTNGVRNINRLRYPTGSISAVFLTHFHSDHIDGLGELATLRWLQGNHLTPMPVYGPKGLSQIVNGFNLAYARDSVYRNDHHGDSVAPLSGHGMIAKPFTVPAEGQSTVVYDQDGLSVEMIAVDHLPVSPAVAYLFKYRDRSVLISGDTDKSKNIEHFAKDIDLLVHEALAPNLVSMMNFAATKTGNAPMAKVLADVLDYHATPVEAAETARDAGVGHLLYYHIVPPLIMPGMDAVWLDGVEDVFTRYTLGQDGTSFSLPINSNDIVKTRSSF